MHGTDHCAQLGMKHSQGHRGITTMSANYCSLRSDTNSMHGGCSERLGGSRVSNTKSRPPPHLRRLLPSPLHLWAELRGSMGEGPGVQQAAQGSTDTCSDLAHAKWAPSPSLFLLRGPQAPRATRSTATGCCSSGCTVWSRRVRTPAKRSSRAS